MPHALDSAGWVSTPTLPGSIPGCGTTSKDLMSKEKDWVSLCGMCGEFREEHTHCELCSHVECKECYDGWIEGQHPCRWLQFKNERSAKTYVYLASTEDAE